MQKRTLSFAEYRDKVLGCWHGKNIGGTLGAPFECLRGVGDLGVPCAGRPGGRGALRL